MTRRWHKLRKRLVGAALPTLRAISPRAAARALAWVGRFEHALVAGNRARHQAAVRRWSHHLGCAWDEDRVGRALAGNEVRWQARDLLLDGLPDRRLAPLFAVRDREHLDAALAGRRGVVLLACHYGSHIVPLHWLLRRGYPLRVYMERPHRISKYLARQFAADGPLGQDKIFISRRFTAAESAASIMRAIKVLRAGMILCLAGDVRWSGPNTVAARFLGAEHHFTATWVVLAAMTSAPVVPVFCRMTRDGSYELEFRPALDVPPETLARRDTGRFVQEYLESIEAQLRLDPANGNEYVNWIDAESEVTGSGAG